MKDQKRFAALALSAIMVVSMAGNVYAAKEIKSKDDLAGATIGVQLGTTGDLDASDYEKDGSTVERYSKGSEAVQALKAGQIDCVIIDSQPAQKFVENNDDLKILDEPFEEEEYAICLKKGNDELLEKINGALEELKKDGTIDSIMDNYIGEDAGKTPYESPEDVDRSNGTLVMATNAEFEPYEYHEGDDIVGIDADIAKAIADKLGLKLEIQDMEFNSIITAVQSGKADLGLAGMTVTDERKQSVDFTDSYATGIQSVIVKEGSSIKSIDDLKGKKIGVQLATTGDIYAKDDFGEENVEEYNKGADAVMALTSGKIDAVIIDNQPAKSFVETTDGLQILDTDYVQEDYAAAIQKGNTDLLNAVNGALKELKEDGTIQKILDKYIK